MMQQQKQHLSVENTTRAAAGWAASPVGQLVRVEVLVTLSCALLTMLVFLGSGRRHSRSAAFRAVVWSALMLSYPAVSYTIGLMQSASFHNELMVIWACFLLGCADGIAACSVDDSDQQARLLLNQAAQTVYVLLLLLSYAASLRLELKILLFLLWVLTVAKLGLRVQRLVSVGRDRVLTVDNGLITKYMEDEFRLSGWRRRPRWEWDTTTDTSSTRGGIMNTMDGYKYVVTGEENLQDDLGEYKLIIHDSSDIDSRSGEENKNIVTLDRVCKWYSTHSSPWQLGNSESYPELLNLCISFALFKLLRRRITGSPQYELHESTIHKVRWFFSKVIVGARKNGGSPMYRIIEMELGFLFDFFYSRYPSHKQTLIPETIVFTTAVALSMSSLFSSTLMHYYGSAMSVADSVIIATRFDIWLARLVIFLFLILEAFQYLSLVLSDWHRLKLFCRYIVQDHSSWLKNHRVLAPLVLRLCHVKMARRYWSNTVGQYSLLHACIQSEITSLWLPSWMRSFLVRTSITTHRHLPNSVKNAIAHEIQSFIRANAEHGGAYYDQPMHIRNILILHIATTVCCQCQKPPAGTEEEEKSVVTILSAYCAYLICHAPELITENIYEAQLLLEGVQRRARQCLKDCRSEDDMYTKLSSFEPNEEDDYGAIMAEGVSLSNLLTSKFPNEADLWRLLTHLWVKFLLSSAAPSNNVAAHVKRLASGGEFITHLWAFMTQGGFVKEPWISSQKKHEWPRDYHEEAAAGRPQGRKEPDIDGWIRAVEWWEVYGRISDDTDDE